MLLLVGLYQRGQRFQLIALRRVRGGIEESLDLCERGLIVRFSLDRMNIPIL